MADNEIERLDATLLVTALTAFGYAAAYAFQVAYLTYFGVPATFVDVGLRELLFGASAALVLVPIFVGIAQWVLPAMAHPPETTGAVRRVFNWVAVFGVPATLGLLLLGFNLRNWNVVLSGVAIVVTAATFATRVSASHAISDGQKELTAFDRFARRIKPSHLRWLNIAIGAGFLIVAVSAAGISKARSAREFFVTTQGLVVLRAQGDQLLCAEFKDDRLTGRYRYVDATVAELELRTVGPFRRFELPTEK